LTPSPLTLNLQSRKFLQLQLGLPGTLLDRFHENRNSIVIEFTQEKYKQGNPEPKRRDLTSIPYKYKIIHKRINVNLLQKAKLLPGAIGGVKGKKIDDFINIHRGAEGYFAFDLKSFFPSISSGRIYQLFFDSGCTAEIAGFLTEITTFKGKLTQGFATSVMLANITAHQMDFQLSAMCKEHNLQYSRWVDDVVISGRIKNLKKVEHLALGYARSNGFELSHGKTSFSPRRSNKPVLGIQIQRNFPSIPDSYIDQLEADIVSLVEGQYDILDQIYPGNELKKKKSIQSSIEGKVDHIGKYHEEIAQRLNQRLLNVNWDELERFRQSLTC